jgi:hypothetical protein
MTLGGGNDRIRLAQICGDRLLDQEIEALSEQRQRHGGVQAGGSRDHDGVGKADEFLRFGERRTAMGPGDALPGFGHGIDHGNEFGIGPRSEQSGMNRSQMSAPDHRHLQAIHAALLRSRARPCRPSC